jgi:glucokinase
VIGGGVATGWDLFAVRMFDELSQGSSIYRLTNPQRATDERMAKATTRVLPAKLGSDAGILGACLLPFSPKRTAPPTSESNPPQY